jgi:hypothetical protein
MAAIATFALKAGLWFRRGRFVMVAPRFSAIFLPISSRSTTQSPCPVFQSHLSDLHMTGGRTNNRAEVSHQPTRQRERQRRRFRSPGSAQRFLATHAAVYNHFNVQRHLISRDTLRKLRSQALGGWREIAAA